MNRGDVVIAATGGGFGGKPRPYIVVQSDRYGGTLVILVGCSTYDGVPTAIRPVIEPNDENGLRDVSEVMVDIPITARREKIGGVIGRLTPPQMAEIDAALLLIFGLTEQPS